MDLNVPDKVSLIYTKVCHRIRNFFSLSIEKICLNSFQIGQSAFHYAVRNNNSEIASLLIEHGIQINLKDKMNRSSLHWAVIEGCPEILERLLREPAELDDKAEEGKSLLHLAVDSGNIECLEILLKNNCDTFATDSVSKVKFANIHKIEHQSHSVTYLHDNFRKGELLYTQQVL